VDVLLTRDDVIVLGIILVVIGYFAAIPILETLGGILVLIGVILWILGAVGRPQSLVLAAFWSDGHQGAQVVSVRCRWCGDDIRF
jgi:hypothetical protein